VQRTIEKRLTDAEKPRYTVSEIEKRINRKTTTVSEIEVEKIKTQRKTE